MNVAISEDGKIVQQEVVAEYQDLEVLQTCEYESRREISREST